MLCFQHQRHRVRDEVRTVRARGLGHGDDHGDGRLDREDPEENGAV